MEPVVLTASRGRTVLTLTCVAMGEDLSVTLSGGDRPHIGAVALAQARASGEEGRGRSATTSVLALLGHKEDDLARTLASSLAARTGATVCVACGIHLEAASAEEISGILALGSGLAERLAGLLEG